MMSAEIFTVRPVMERQPTMMPAVAQVRMVEMTPENFSDNLGKITEMEKNLVAALKAMLGIYAKVRLVAPKTIARSEGKAVRVIDKRKI